MKRSFLASFTAVAAAFLMGFGFFQSNAKANDVYISQSGGSAGSSCSSPLVYTYFNNSKNWTSGAPTGTQIGPGTTVYLCGTFTAAAGTSGYLTFQGSGTSGNVITLHFESGAVIQAPYWGANGAILATSLSYVTVDGGTNGVIQATLAGSVGATCLGGACTYQPSSAGNGVTLASCNNVEVKNLTVADLYVHTSTTNDPNGNSGGVGINSSNNVTVDHDTMHDMANAIWVGYTPSGNSGFQFFDNTIYNINWGVAGGDSTNGSSLSNVMIYGNSIHDFENWDTTSDYWHHDGIYIWITGTTSSINAPYYVYNNYFNNMGGTCSAPMFSMQATSGFLYVFNNVVNNASGCGDGALAVNANVMVFNNTVVQGWISGNANTSSMTFENNISRGGYYLLGTSPLSSSDYNDWFAANQSSNGIAMHYNGVNYGTVADFAAATGFDTHSLISNPNLSPNYTPSSGSPVIGAGTNLYSVCNGQPNPGLGALCSDAAGNPRPSSGNWTMGAYNPTGGGAPDPPTNVAAIAH